MDTRQRSVSHTTDLTSANANSPAETLFHTGSSPEAPCEEATFEEAATEGPSDALPEGALLHGNCYAIDAVLGQGGFGITYRGRDLRLSRQVAVKEFFPAGCVRQAATLQPAGSLSRDDFMKCKDRFLRETRTLARFHHPGIADVYDIFEENNTAYMVMEYVEGETLGAHLLRQGNRLATGTILDVALQVAAALEEVHQAGLLHLDIKPDNIILCQDSSPSQTSPSRVVLVDFGAAREFSTHHTQQHSVVLTPGYAPLEQYARQAQRGVYTDIYALAATLYHLLTGHAPATASERALGVPLEPWPDGIAGINPDFAAALHAGLQLEGKRRPASVRDFVSILDGKPATTEVRPQLSPGPAVAIATSSSAASTRSVSSDAMARDTKRSPAEESGASRRNRALAAGLACVAIAVSAYAVLRQYRADRLPQVGDFAQTKPAKVAAATEAAPLTPPTRIVQLANYENLGSLGKPATMEFNLDATRLAGSERGGRFKVWDTASGKLLQSLATGSVPGQGGAVSADGTVAAMRTDKARLYSESDLNTLSVERRRAYINSLTPGGISVLNLQTGSSLCRVKPLKAGYAMALSPDGRLLAHGDAFGSMEIWNTRNGAVVLRQPEPKDNGSKVGITCLLFAPDSKTLAAGYADHTLRIWQVSGSKQLHSFFGHTDYVDSMAMAPDQKQLVTVHGGRFRLWDVNSERFSSLASIPGSPVPYTGAISVVFSPDSKRIAGLQNYGSLSRVANPAKTTAAVIWDRQGRFLQACALSDTEIVDIAFADGHQFLRGVSAHGRILEWKVQ